MTQETLDTECNKLFRRLDELKAQGKDQGADPEYTAVLYALRELTRARVGNLIGQSI